MGKKEINLGTRIFGEPEVDTTNNGNTRLKLLSSNLVSEMDYYRKLKIEREDLTIGTIDAVDNLTERAINKIEEANMLITKALFKTNK